MPPRRGAPAKNAKAPPKTKEQEARDKANLVDDTMDPEYKKSLRIECRDLEKRIE